MKTRAPELRALMSILGSAGPVISTRRSSRSAGAGATVQASIWIMGRAILARHDEIEVVRMVLPNLHHWLVDLSPFGLENDREIFTPTTEPHGLIEATVRRGEG